MFNYSCPSMDTLGRMVILSFLPTPDATDQPLQYYYDTSQSAAADEGNNEERPRVIALHV